MRKKSVEVPESAGAGGVAAGVDCADSVPPISKTRAQVKRPLCRIDFAAMIGASVGKCALLRWIDGSCDMGDLSGEFVKEV
jgi:hypothetical protein